MPEEIALFQEHKDFVFKAMCELFGIDDPVAIKKIEDRYKWYRKAVTQYQLLEKYRITSDSLFTSDMEDSWDLESADSE